MIKSDKKFSEKIKERIQNNLKLGLTNENAEIAYSALFGDKDLLSDKQYDELYDELEVYEPIEEEAMVSKKDLYM